MAEASKLHPKVSYFWCRAEIRPPAPIRPGALTPLERLTALGPMVALWDGRSWWTPETNGNHRGVRGPRCLAANQALPWRAIESGPFAQKIGVGG